MDINALSMDMAQSQLATQVGTSLLARSLGDAEAQGAALLKLLSSAAPAPLAEGSGQAIDLLA
jgi:hypothetical protein